MINKANITCDLCHIILAESDDGLFKKMTVYNKWETIVEKESGSCGYGVIKTERHYCTDCFLHILTAANELRKQKEQSK